MTSRRVVDWLLDPSEPSVRYRALRELLGRSESDPEVREARRRIPEQGWAADILAARDAAGWWERPGNLYTPKYFATNWRMIVLSDLGLTRDHPAVRASAELWMDRFPLAGGGVGGNAKGVGHHCLVGNMTRSLIRLGYADDPRVRRSLDWLVETSSPLGGWSCFGSGRNLDSWEGLSAFALYPKSRWNAAMTACVERGAQFFLERELHRQGDRYAPWWRFHYPVHYYYDLLVGLDLLTRLGYSDDPRLRTALAHLRQRRRPDGRWNLDALHPDIEGGMAEWYDRHPKQKPRPWGLEVPGKPSRMITLLACGVLDRVEGTAPAN